MSQHKKALVIGGGAPNMPLMAGALAAMLRQKVDFDVISTSGAGALIGLLYAAPKGGTPIEALANIVQMGVADPIYNAYPINYKIFNKPGVLADLFRQQLNASPYAQLVEQLHAISPGFRIWSDWQQLMWAIATPSDLSADSLGLCAHVPFVEEVVDFARMRDFNGHFYLNAYNLDRHEMTIWHGKDVDATHFRAALSFPFLYPPTELPGKDGKIERYIEGAAIDTLNFKALLADHGPCSDVDTLIVFDVLGAEQLLRAPTSLYDAWVMSIITPLTEIARDDLKLFELVHNRKPDGSAKRALLKVPLLSKDLPAERWQQMFDWSYSNMHTLFRIGFDVGLKFAQEHAQRLDISYDPSVQPLPEGWVTADVVGPADAARSPAKPQPGAAVRPAPAAQAVAAKPAAAKPAAAKPVAAKAAAPKAAAPKAAAGKTVSASTAAAKPVAATAAAQPSAAVKPAPRPTAAKPAAAKPAAPKTPAAKPARAKTATARQPAAARPPAAAADGTRKEADPEAV
ncbi:Patatin-like phospholipase [Andreprevotia lacus DSM 23236]|jgi:predicted acylesterase/phospholipase RssA|uniref:Patatin-like phospholipase n=1 Tax=Andreprevotia lacus DSM 23236 TaxID=1121001 RepID=A0A1W1XRH1_9NEIS|nr:patatin-like phospholipase family protein [Andreprevotia lacus]SMC26445.1 Patatin-like phospholipase [Andreprevotia lacus DSM 23236]